LPTVLFVCDEWGYGTTTIALAIAEALAGRADRLFAGGGPAYNLARRRPPLEHLVHTPTRTAEPAPALTAALRASDVVVSIMNKHVARLAGEHGKPCVYVDCLRWMWPEPTVPSTVEHYFIEWFPGVDTRERAWHDRLPGHEIVGPLISRPPIDRPTAPRGVLVNFGGLESYMIEHDRLAGYAAAMIDCIVSALPDPSEPVRICLGEHVMDDVVRQLETPVPGSVSLVDLDHRDYFEALDASRILVSSAGMQAMYEAIDRGVPCLALPSQNLSQLLTLRTLHEIGSTEVVDWDQLFRRLEVSAQDEPAACRTINGCALQLRGDPAAFARLSDHLRSVLVDPAAERQTIRRESFGGQVPTPGTPRLAEYVLDLAERRAAVGG